MGDWCADRYFRFVQYGQFFNGAIGMGYPRRVWGFDCSGGFKMKATPALRKWFDRQLKDRGLDRQTFSELSGVSHATWSRFMHGHQYGLSAESVEAMCKMFKVSELEIYQISNGRKPLSPDVEDLAKWLNKQPKEIQNKIFRSAKRQNWQSKSNQINLTQ